MANRRLLVKRLKAVRNIRKITRTMELIATSRFKKAMDRATEAAEYTRKISEIVGDLGRANLKFSHPLLEQPSGRETQHSAGSDCKSRSVRRLQRECAATVPGAYSKSEGERDRVSAGSFRQAWDQVPELPENPDSARSTRHFEDQPSFAAVEALGTRYVEDFIAGRIDRLDVAYTQFVTSSKQFAVVETLLPIGSLDGGTETKSEAGIDYEFLPSAQEILAEIVPAAFRAKLFKCFLDAAVSEQIARMVAMKGATENADEMAGSLKQQYNRARQAGITSELAEIIGGAAALG